MLGWCSQLPGKRVKAGPETQVLGKLLPPSMTCSVAKPLNQCWFFPRGHKTENVLKNTFITLHAVCKLVCVVARVWIQVWVSWQSRVLNWVREKLQKRKPHLMKADLISANSVFQWVRRIVLVYSPLGQARNFLRAMKLEQEAFFYHSNCKEPGIAGLVKVSCIGVSLNPSPFSETYSCSYKGTQLKSVTKRKYPTPHPWCHHPSLFNTRTIIRPSSQVTLVQTSLHFRALVFHSKTGLMIALQTRGY